MSLWDKKDSLYIEANTLNVVDSHFYHYYPGYSEFFKNEPLGFSLYIPDDTDKNNIKFNYTLKDVNWHEYSADEMEEEIFLFQDKYDSDETGHGRGLIPIVVASNGGGEQSALLFQIKSANGDENVSPQFGFMNTIGYGSYCYTEGIKNISWVLMNLVYQKDSNSYIFTLDLYDTVEKNGECKRILNMTHILV